MRIDRILTLVVCPALVAIASCGLEPYEPRAPQEMPDGPGLFTGPEGVFMLAAPPRGSRERKTSQSGGAAENYRDGAPETDR